MVRRLYGLLLLLHPPAFRQRFAAELMSVFDEACHAEGAAMLLLDAMISLARQWILRTGSWKILAAFVFAGLQVTAGGLFWIAIGRDGARPAVAHDRIALERLMQIILAAGCLVVILVTAAAVWVGSFLRRR